MTESAKPNTRKNLLNNKLTDDLTDTIELISSYNKLRLTLGNLKFQLTLHVPRKTFSDS